MIVKSPAAGAVAGLGAGLAGVLVVVLLAGTAGNSEDAAETAEAIREAQTTNTESLDRITEQFLASIERTRVDQLSAALACAERPGQQTAEQIARCIRKAMR